MALANIVGTQCSLKRPVHKSSVKVLLLWRPANRCDHRDRLLVCLMTIACMCVGEVTRLQICDIWFDFFTTIGDTFLFGTASTHICSRKNDGARSGHHPSRDRSVDPGCDIVTQLRAWARSHCLSQSTLAVRNASILQPVARSASPSSLVLLTARGSCPSPRISRSIFLSKWQGMRSNGA
jgi:hypothetical protein